MVTSYGSAEFKTHCLRILDEVVESGQTVLLTKRGRPVAQVVPLPSEDHRPVFGLLRGSVHWSDDLISTGEAWDADAR